MISSGRPGATGTGAPDEYSSTTRWALEPPAPNELTAATLGSTPPSAARAGHGRGVRWTSKTPAPVPISGFGSSACSDGTSVRWRSWSRILVSPAMPAAASA